MNSWTATTKAAGVAVYAARSRARPTRTPSLCARVQTAVAAISVSAAAAGSRLIRESAASPNAAPAAAPQATDDRIGPATLRSARYIPATVKQMPALIDA